jgi:tRNA threonylcarbamoyladenosine biosynthesis protein TsaE
MILEVTSEDEMKQWGAKLGALLEGGEIIELIGDVGAGKTTLTKGIATGMQIDETVQSPSFTISRVYEAPSGVRLAHYDFYRLQDAGIMADELHETLHDEKTVTIIEWADIVDGVLPADHVKISISALTETDRHIEAVAGGERSQALIERLA